MAGYLLEEASLPGSGGFGWVLPGRLGPAYEG